MGDLIKQYLFQRLGKLDFLTIGCISSALTMACLSPIASASHTQINPYGFILPKWVFSSAGLTSLTSPQQPAQNESAPTAAARADQGMIAHPRSTWQIGQSRFGAKFSPSNETTAQIEVDFFNNIQHASSGFTLLSPRLRIAKIEYPWMIAPDRTVSLTLGQDWDIFNGGISAASYNFVGNYFQSGNIGFLRQQCVLKVTDSNGWIVSTALGMPQKNDPTSSSPGVDGGPELSLLPSFALNLTWQKNTKTFYGISGIISRILFSPSTDQAHLAGGASIFFAQEWPTVSIRGKFYSGKNLSNLNMLTLSSGSLLSNTAYDILEWGGFFTLSTSVTESCKIFSGLGYASIVNAHEIPFSLSPSLVVLVQNLKSSLGVDWKLSKNLTSYAEFSLFRSSYNEGSTITHSYLAKALDIGMKFDID